MSVGCRCRVLPGFEGQLVCADYARHYLVRPKQEGVGGHGSIPAFPQNLRSFDLATCWFLDAARCCCQHLSFHISWFSGQLRARQQPKTLTCMWNATHSVMHASHSQMRPQEVPVHPVDNVSHLSNQSTSHIFPSPRVHAGVELFRIIVCAGNRTSRAPTDLVTWDPNRVGWLFHPAGHAAANSKQLRAKVGSLWRACSKYVHIRLRASPGAGGGWLAVMPNQVEDLDGWPQQSVVMQL